MSEHDIPPVVGEKKVGVAASGMLPSGTVTFLFTDIEGSTQLWDSASPAMAAALERHDSILRAVIEGHSGVVFATAGDGMAAAFARATDAVAAAVETQQALGSVVWPEGAAIRVRMGLHTGEAQERAGDYFGPAVNRAARIMGAGHGGQLLLSAATANLVDRADLLDLGAHSLAGLSAAERLFQVGPGAFPPLRVVGSVLSNMPAERSLFIGRASELAEVGRLLGSARVVTLTGVGGVGKSRLALQAAARVLEEFPDGTWLVELAPLVDAGHVASAVASAVGAPLSPGAEGEEAVCRFLAQKRALVALDNCEHVIEQVAVLVDRLLEAAPRVAVLTTSREPLDVRGEVVWRVPSLGVEDEHGEPGDAVALFAERAREVQPGFELDDSNRATVVQLCRRLDGIPLAIELAAARMRVMSVEQIAVRLDERFRLLTRGRRTAVARQQTLQAAIDWSYELLNPAERQLFDVLGVFAGDFDLDAAAAVSGIDSLEALDLVEQLVEKSMLEADPARDRYRLLETLRQYAWDRLVATGCLAAARDAHAAHYTALAGEQGALMSVPGRPIDALNRLELDYDNLRAALAYLIEGRRADDAARLVRRLSGLFNIRHPSEGFKWFKEVIEIADQLPTRTRARLLGEIAQSAMVAADVDSPLHYAQLAVDIGGPDAPAVAHFILAQELVYAGEHWQAVEHARQGIMSAAAAGDLTNQVTATGELVRGYAGLGMDAAVHKLVPELLDLAERLANPTITAAAYFAAGSALAVLGHARDAVDIFQRGLAYADTGGPIAASNNRVALALEIEDPGEAIPIVNDAISIARSQHSGHYQLAPLRPQFAALLPAARLLIQEGKSEVAAQLIGAHRQHDRVSGSWSHWRNRLLDNLTDSLGGTSLSQELDKGSRLTPDEALRLAAEAISSDVTASQRFASLDDEQLPATSPDPSTPTVERSVTS